MSDPYVTALIYFIALGALTLCVFVRGTSPMLRTILTILAVCVAGWSYSWFIAYNEGYAIFMVAVDAIACRVITWKPAGKWQSIVGLSYLLQIAVHVGRLAASNPDLNIYGIALTILAFLQLLLVVGWWTHELLVRRGWSFNNPLSASSRGKGVGG